MKAFLIDPKLKYIAEVNFEGDYKEIYKWIEANTFDCVNLNSDADTLYLDDEGLLKRSNYFWQIEILSNIKSTYAGRGLVLGTDDEGESTDVKTITLEQLKKDITFLGEREIL